ncbi:MAG: ImmA/IrrE family metallo-endopeptidase [Armatimonadetes bacterium]|nr:ImmA/IrrE family metallo-endopeptidase [Armatimonadota bacterium]
MTKLHFEDEAEMYAHKAWQTLKLEIPVDLAKVASRLGIIIHEKDFVDEIDGLYLRINGAPPIISINSSYKKPLMRRRFTLAHEIGHHLLGRRINPGNRLFFVDAGKTQRTLIERACNRFAAQLLMPEDLVKHHYNELCYNAGQRVAIMAERFGVSGWAMRRRLKEMGLEVSSFRR